MKICILTIFPGIFSGFLDESLIKKSQENSLCAFSIINIRDFASPPHFQVDDTPYGGGAGMVMKPEPIGLAVEAAKQAHPHAKTVLLSPRGSIFNQKKSYELSQQKDLILICGRYEGIDERVKELYVDEEISIGDYVLMGGEVAAMVVIEAVVRLLKGVIGNEESLRHESFGDVQSPLLEASQYTRPPEYKGKKVPEVLLSGNHGEINSWRERNSIMITKERRPDLLKK